MFKNMEVAIHWASKHPSKMKRANVFGDWFEPLKAPKDKKVTEYDADPEATEQGPYEDRRNQRRYDQDGLKSPTNTQESMGHDKMTDYRPGGGGNCRTYKTMWGSKLHRNGRGQS